MKNGYDQFFKKAQKVADQNSGAIKFKTQPASTRLHLDLASEDIEKQLRRRAGIKTRAKKKKSSFSWKMAGFSFMGLLMAVWGFQNHEQVEKLLHRVEVDLLGIATAAPEVAPAATNKAPASVAAPVEKITSEEVDHLTKLNVRKKELDAREEELNRMEAELQVQKQELEKRMVELEEMRGKISSILDDRVKADDQKVDTLVQMYSNMKPPQAAKVFETMDEDLAVEILGRMKKKNAADIMNLLKPEKAQIISEKFAGYKRR